MKNGVKNGEKVALEVALAFAKAWSIAGRKVADRAEPVADRAANLVRCGYVVAGDPCEWGEGQRVEALATVFGERRGGPGDCEPPVDYWDGWPVLDGHLWWEWVNAAVGLVYSTGKGAGRAE